MVSLPVGVNFACNKSLFIHIVIILNQSYEVHYILVVEAPVGEHHPNLPADSLIMCIVDRYPFGSFFIDFPAGSKDKGDSKTASDHLDRDIGIRNFRVDEHD